MNAPLRLHWPFSSYLPTVDVKQPAVLSLMKKVIFLCCVTALNSDSLLRAVAIFTMPTRCSCWLVVFLLPLIPSPTEYIYLRKWYRDILSTTVSFCINATVMFNVIHCTTTTATTMDSNNNWQQQQQQQQDVKLFPKRSFKTGFVWNWALDELEVCNDYRGRCRKYKCAYLMTWILFLSLGMLVSGVELRLLG